MRSFCLPVVALLFFVACDGDGTEEAGPTSSVSNGAGGDATAGTNVGGNGNSGGTSSAGGSGSGGMGCSTTLLTDDTRLPDTLAQQMLDMHNAKRTEYCLEPMVWDCDLARVAQDYADLGAGDLPHNDQRHAQYAAIASCGANCPQLGENIAWHSPYDFFPLTDGVDAWLSEEDAQSCNEGGGHYTQIVWETATRVGCGMWIDDNDKLHLVCNYIEFQLSGPAFPIANCSGCN